MATQESKTEYSEPAYGKTADRLKKPFYHANIEHKIPPELRTFLEEYSKVARDEQSEHIHKIRDQAFDIRAYPCTGLGSWLVPQFCQLPIYPEALQRVKDGAVFLDVGTFVGHDLRRLVHDGAPSDKLYGVDIADHFDVGYDFFRDREHFKGHFIEADFLSETSPELNALKKNVDIVLINQVMHQWNWDGQVKAAKALSSFTKPGSIIAGNQMGQAVAGEVSLKDLNGMNLWRHNSESCAKMWKDVGELTDTKWEVQAWLRTFADLGWDPNDAAWMDPDVRVMEFTARRLA